MGKGLTAAIICICVVLMSGVTNANAQKKTSDSSGSNRTALERILENAKVPGAQIIYTKKGKSEIYHLGVTNVETKEPVTDDTVFQAASLTKVVAAYAVLRLVDRGEFDLDKPLTEYVEYDRIKDDPKAKLITARMILSHRTGFPNWAIGPSNPNFEKTPVKTNFTPGSSWNYSGEGFFYLQKALEEKTGKKIEMIIYDEVLKPFKMDSTFLKGLKRLIARQAYGHNAEGIPGQRRSFPQPNIAYTLLTTAGDYDKFIQEGLIKGKGLKNKTHELFFSVQGNADRLVKPSSADPYIDWGLGIGLQKNEIGYAVWHWGDNGPFKCFFMAFPQRKESLIVMTNSQNATDAYEDILRLFFGKQTFWAVTWVKDGG